MNVGTYKITSGLATSPYFRKLNLYSSGSVSNGMNVVLYETDQSDEQKWYFDGERLYPETDSTHSYCLDRYAASTYLNNADIWKASVADADCQKLSIIPVSADDDYYRIRLDTKVNNEYYYLTAYSNANGTGSGKSTTSAGNVYWAPATGGWNQKWDFSEVGGSSGGNTGGDEETGGSEYSENYAIYPCKHMNITQRADGTYNHYLYSDPDATYRDFPTDEGCADSGRSPMYCPCDEMIVEHFRGTGDNEKVNTIWLRSTSKVKFANGDEDYLVMMVMHPNDSDFSGLVKGVTTFRRGEIMFYEGTDGATANHFHISLGKGARIGNGWIENSNGAWVLYTTNGNLPIEDVFYVDPNFTTIRNDAGLDFVTLP